MTKAYIIRNMGTSKVTYHTDPECQYIRHGDLRETSVQTAEAEDKDKCRKCDGQTYHGTKGGGKSDLERLLERGAVSD